MSESEGSDLTGVEEVWFGDQSVAGDEFVEALNAVEELRDATRGLKDELEDLDVGLDRDDAQRLIYARNADMTLTQVESAFEVIDVIVNAPLDEIGPRLMADQSSDLTISEAAEVWDDMIELAQKYGDTPNNDD